MTKEKLSEVVYMYDSIVMYLASIILIAFMLGYLSAEVSIYILLGMLIRETVQYKKNNIPKDSHVK